MGLLPEIFSAPYAPAGTRADVAAATPPTAAEFKKFRKLSRKKRKQVGRDSGKKPKN